MLLMRAFLTIVSPRPPGNLHVGQTYSVSRLPPADRPMLASAVCSAKEIRKGRMIAQFGVTLSDMPGIVPMVSGISTIFWAQ